MSVLEEVLKNNSDLLVKIIDLMQGKEVKATVNLNGVEFKVGDSKVSLGGKIELAFAPFAKKKK